MNQHTLDIIFYFDCCVQYKYKCSEGYHLSNKTNPDQLLRCEGTRAVNTDNLETCYRK